MEKTVYNLEGTKVSTVKLPDNVFAVRWNADLVSQVVNSLLSSARKNIAHTKTRGEVRGGGKKPWKQKGTGRARHGSIRSPIWVGGGVTHGPRNDKNYERKVSKKMKSKALFTILSRKLHEGEVLFVDSLTFNEPKAKHGLKALGSLSSISGFESMFKKRKNAIAIATADKNKSAERAFSNFSNVEVMEARNLNPVTLLQYKYLVLENPEKSVKVLAKEKQEK